MKDVVMGSLVKDGDGTRLVFWAIASVVVGYIITIVTYGV